MFADSLTKYLMYQKQSQLKKDTGKKSQFKFIYINLYHKRASKGLTNYMQNTIHHYKIHITHIHTVYTINTLTPMGSFDSPVDPACMRLDDGGKPTRIRRFKPRTVLL